ncbi:DUF6090 family protein [Seonamhaeicola marinus]|uniref:Uncharacterized protein n=1 Tax=Seonamhaeicola marinus TaxID=1912246 RepID=A0A5D0HWI4_9FLAO|nr:DUF6090 family protein [Seonamhaeicola marinus]TYA74879.1 hypothetical protein FUA24_16380 [Seonamhaeicola marinus]
MKDKVRYALGEIIIVIIGISIAFSLNKCSENSKNEKLKLQYLQSLKNDLEIDKTNLTQNVKSLETKIETLEKVLPLFNLKDLKKKRGINQIFSIIELSEFHPKDITYQSMINSGDFSLIEDLSLKNAIENHYSGYKTILKDYERQLIIHKKYLGDYFIYNMDYDAMQKGGFGFKDENLLKNILLSMNGSFKIKKNASKRGITSCDSLLKVLNKAL